MGMQVKQIAVRRMLFVGMATVVLVTDLTVPALSAEQADSIEEIVVTARKTQESLQSVPLSISAITAADLEKRPIASLAALGQSTPNFSFSEQAQAGRTAAVIYIRGVGQSDVLATFDAAVGLYLDGVYLGRMQGLDMDSMDLERVEILRGPQGTLFGKNTDGGAVNIVTKQPDPSADANHGRLQLTTGNFNRFDVVGGVNLPLVDDKLAMDVSFAHRGRSGYGQRSDGQQMANTNRDSGRLSILYKPVDRLTLLLSADGFASKEYQSSYKLIKVGTYYSLPQASLGGKAFNDFLSQPYDSRWITNSAFTYDGTGPNSARSDLWGTAVTATWDATVATIKSTTAYRRNLSFNDLDVDGSPVNIIEEYETVKQHQFSQELQATGSSFDDRLKWVTGLYYFDESASDISNYRILSDFGNSFSFSQVLYIHNKSYAIYGQSDYGITDKLKLTTGIRLNRDEKSVFRLKLAYPSGIPYDVTTDNAPTTRADTWDSTSPRLGLNYQWSPGLMTYISAADGFKGGGFNGRAGSVAAFNEYRPEKVRTYEGGMRSDWLNNRLRFNATVFYSIYTDLQLQVNGAGHGTNGQPVPAIIVGNIPLAHIKGAELEVVGVPLSGFTVNANVGLTNARYIQLLPGAPVTLSTPFIDTPKVSGDVGAEYTTDRVEKLKITGRLDYGFKSTISYDVSNASNLITQKAYGLLNGKLTFDIKNSGWSFALFGTNLIDRRYIIGGWDQCTSSTLAFCIVEYGAPREWGVSGEYHY
jgi:iron complex outermembrane receptor protein